MSGEFHLLKYKGFIVYYMKPASSSVSQNPGFVCAVHILILCIFLTWTKETNESKVSYRQHSNLLDSKHINAFHSEPASGELSTSQSCLDS